MTGAFVVRRPRGLWIEDTAPWVLRGSIFAMASAQVWTLIALLAAAQFATFFEMRRLAERVSDGFAELRAEISGLRVEMSELRAELRGEMAALRVELKADIADLRRDLHDYIALGH